MRERIRASIIAGVGCVFIALVPGAHGAVMVGQVSDDADPNNCPGENALVTTGVSSGTSFVVPAGGGVITSWQTMAGSGSSNTTAKLKVYRTTDDPNEFLVVGQSGFQPINPLMRGVAPRGGGTLNGPFPARVPVKAGDFVSIFTGSNGGPCNDLTASALDVSRVTQGDGDTPTGMTTTFYPAPGNLTQRANVSAVLEADGDADGFGDESQDNCVGSGGPQNGCPLPSQPPGNPGTLVKEKKKKCKKAKKRSAPRGVKRCKKGRK